MNKPCYTDYVRHAMRFYSRYSDKTRFKNKVDEYNWRACHVIVSKYSERDKDILLYVYGAFDTIADNVYTMSNKYRINQNIIWDMMKDLERDIAIERGLTV